MSIVPLMRVTFIGLDVQKERLLDDLHEWGNLELIPLQEAAEQASESSYSSSREALKFLLSCPQRRRQMSDESRFDAVSVEHQALELQRRLQTLELERDALAERIADLKPWGDFYFPPPEELGGRRLWFYVVKHQDMPKVQATEVAWEVVGRDSRSCYVVVVAENEPLSMPVPRVHTGSRSPKEVAYRLEEVELAIEDAQAERAYLTRWCLLLARSLTHLDNVTARTNAANETYDRNPVFAIQAWMPQENEKELAEYAAKQGLVFHSEVPSADESPPTLMRNPPRVSAGEDLVSFYMTPDYWAWDPSSIVFISFAIFFAMILADAGYAAMLGLGLLVFWRRLSRSSTAKRFRPLLLVILLASLAYGVLVGSYFGIAPNQGSFLARLHLLDMSNLKIMMGLSILVGSAHVMLANIMDARRHSQWRDGLASIGWACVVAGGLIIAAGALLPQHPPLTFIGGGVVVLGLLLVVGFTAPREKPLKRLVGGVLGLTKVSSIFGDILSYLRLFALGLASASLALAFNDMASGIRSGAPRIGLLLALLVLTLGHALNLLLGISSGVIHGLRLNLIEFFNWGLKDEGRRFVPFRRKEGSMWL